jgi:hypothetical protein
MKTTPSPFGAERILEQLLAKAPEQTTRHPVVRRGDREPIPRLVRLLVWRRDEGRCQMCGARNRPTEIDHIQPWSAGGPDDSSNLRLLCGPCNQDRSNFQIMDTGPATPVTLCCDWCLVRYHAHNPLRCRYYPACPVCGQTPSSKEAYAAWCGCCARESTVRDPRRLL